MSTEDYKQLKYAFSTLRNHETLQCMRHQAEALLTIMGDTADSDEHSVFVDVFISVEELVELREMIDAFIYNEKFKDR